MENFSYIQDSYTRTWWRKNHNRHFGVNGGNLYLDNTDQWYQRARIRCVRDVEIVK